MHRSYIKGAGYSKIGICGIPGLQPKVLDSRPWVMLNSSLDSIKHVAKMLNGRAHSSVGRAAGS